MRVTRGRPQGITSACAEQTQPLPTQTNQSRDHLRVCGADLYFRWNDILREGSPPRVRSRLEFNQRPGKDGRITSACAEQTMGKAGG